VGALTAPTSVALTCRWRSRPQHQLRTLVGAAGPDSIAAEAFPTSTPSGATCVRSPSRSRRKWGRLLGPPPIAAISVLIFASCVEALSSKRLSQSRIYEYTPESCRFDGVFSLLRNKLVASGVKRQERTLRGRSKALYSITSSAVASSEGGTVRPSVLAILRLRTSR
jgi:hypothetical protein